MMSESSVRRFSDDAAVRRVGMGLLAQSLPKADWTHEAHLGACVWLICERPDILPERDLPAIIAGYNESVGGVNDATQGYHHTITLTFVAAVRDFLSRVDQGLALHEKVNALLAAPQGQRCWPLSLYSPARLFSIDARLGYVAPDLPS